MWGPSDSEWKFIVWAFAIACGIVGFVIGLFVMWVI